MLTAVASFTEPWEAHLFRLRLEAESVPAFLAGEHHVWAMWPYALALGGVRILVPESLAEEARRIESSCRSGEYRAALASERGNLDDEACPRCGLARFTSRRSVLQLILLFASYLSAGVIFPIRASIHRCGSCGTRWNDKLSARIALLSLVAAVLLLSPAYIPLVFR